MTQYIGLLHRRIVHQYQADIAGELIDQCFPVHSIQDIMNLHPARGHKLQVKNLQSHFGDENYPECTFGIRFNHHKSAEMVLHQVNLGVKQKVTRILLKPGYRGNCTGVWLRMIAWEKGEGAACLQHEQEQKGTTIYCARYVSAQSHRQGNFRVEFAIPLKTIPLNAMNQKLI